VTDIVTVGLDFAAIRQRLLDTPVIGYKTVQGAADFDAALDSGISTDLAGFLLPLADAPDESEFTNTVMQEVTAAIAVVTAVRCLRDARGEAALDLLRPIRVPLFNTLINWSPNGDEFAPFNYAGGQKIGFRNQTLFWQDDFVSSYTIRKD
jgi:hypothetical protein